MGASSICTQVNLTRDLSAMWCSSARSSLVQLSRARGGGEVCFSLGRLCQLAGHSRPLARRGRPCSPRPLKVAGSSAGWQRARPPPLGARRPQRNRPTMIPRPACWAAATPTPTLAEITPAKLSESKLQLTGRLLGKSGERRAES